MNARKIGAFSVGPVRFVRRPVSHVPPDGIVCVVDNGTDTGWSWRVGAMFKDGKWTNGRGEPLDHEPTFWTTLAGDVV